MATAPLGAALQPLIPGSITDALERPRRIPDLELVGQMQDTAFEEEQWLLCYAGSDYIQATKLLYHVLLYADGQTPVAEIAGRVRADTGEDVSADDVRWLVEHRLAPSGLLVLPDQMIGGEDDDDEEIVDSPPPVPTAEMPLLGVRYRISLLPYRVTAPITGVLQHLFWPPIMVSVLLIAAAINVWLYRDSPLLDAAETVMFNPSLMLPLLALSVSSVLFHEFGHASALRRAGSPYGSIGAALYVIWPVFYTDVTHAYRLSRGQRIRVDLGGMYFDLIWMIGLYVAYQITGEPLLLIAIMILGIGFIDQFTPFLRFDGYYTIADIMGVHEPLSLVGPFIRDHLPWPRNKKRRLPPMRRGATVAFLVYLLLIVAFLAYPLALGSLFGTSLIEQISGSGQAAWDEFIAAWNSGVLGNQVVAAIQLGMWFLIPLGLTLFMLNLARQLGRGLIALLRLVRRKRDSVVVSDGSDDGAAAMPGREVQMDATHMFEANGARVNHSAAEVHGAATGSPEGTADIDRLIERMGAQYMANLRALSEEFGRVLEARLSAKAQQMSDLRQQAESSQSRLREKDEQIGDLVRRLEAVERERDVLRERLRVIERAAAQYAADLRALSDELTWSAERVDGDRDESTPEAHVKRWAG